MQTILGQKIGMTQVFAPDGATVPVTVVQIPEARVTMLKTVERDGYVAVQIGSRLVSDDKRAARVIARPQRGQLKASGASARVLFEFRTDKEELAKVKIGDPVSLGSLKVGDAIDIAGTSKGRGFAGVVKRHHFKGGPASHGHKDNLRAPGAINSGHPQHVPPGRRMAGHMGAALATLKNLEIILVDPAKRVVLIKGSVPGAMRSWLWLKPTGKPVKYPIKERKALASVTVSKVAAKPAAKEKKK
ncbi:MAG: 50S ribosomal protein L3 [Parcubacteria group bacterium]